MSKPTPAQEAEIEAMLASLPTVEEEIERLQVIPGLTRELVRMLSWQSFKSIDEVVAGWRYLNAGLLRHLGAERENDIIQAASKEANVDLSQFLKTGESQAR